MAGRASDKGHQNRHRAQIDHGMFPMGAESHTPCMQALMYSIHPDVPAMTKGGE